MNEFGQVLENVSLKNYTSLKVGGICKYLIKPNNKNELINLLKYLKHSNIKYYFLGNGTNVILDDSYFDGVVIKLDNFKDITYKDNMVTVQCGMPLGMLVSNMLQKGFVNLSFASMIPGLVGASVVGNAGCYNHEIMEYVKCVTVLDENLEEKVLFKEDINFGYRYTSLKGKYIVLDVTFICIPGDTQKEKQIIKERNTKRIESQPLEYPNCGSVFRNPENTSAGKLIDELGLKENRIGDAMISAKHANFIVNLGNATFEDILALINVVKSKVKETYQIDLVLEPSIVRWSDL